jgi:hypothetical protein
VFCLCFKNKKQINGKDNSRKQGNAKDEDEADDEANNDDDHMKDRGDNDRGGIHPPHASIRGSSEFGWDTRRSAKVCARFMYFQIQLLY